MKRKPTEPVDFYGPWPFGLPTKTPWMCHWNEPSRNGISIWGLRTSVSVRQTRDGGWPVWWSTWNKEEMQPTVEIRDPGQDVQGSQIASKRIGGAGALIFLVELRKMWTLQSDCTTWFAISLRVVCGGVFVLVQYPEKFCLDLRVIRASNHPMRLTVILENVNAIYLHQCALTWLWMYGLQILLWFRAACTFSRHSSKVRPWDSVAAWTRTVLLQCWTMPRW